MAISKKQKAAIAAIIIAGLLGSIAVLLTGRTSGNSEEGHEHAEHAEAKGHGDAEHHGQAADEGHANGKAHADEEHHEAVKKGPHGGNLYTRDSDAVELAMAEEGGEARLRVWITKGGKPVAPGFRCLANSNEQLENLSR